MAQSRHVLGSEPVGRLCAEAPYFSAHARVAGAGAALGGSQMRKDSAGQARMRTRTAVALALLATTASAAFPAAASGRAKDRDHDGLSNRYEVRVSKTSPRRSDTDRDRLGDRYELKRAKTNPRRRDSDRDGLSDGYEVRRSKTNPLRKDTDSDGLTDRFELRRLGTSPRRADTDRDGVADGVEVLLGSDPLQDPPRGLQGDPPPDDDDGPVIPSVLDLIPPDTTINSGPSGTIASRSASFSFSSNEPGSSFECKLDSGGWAQCTSPRPYSGLANGQHTFSVRARDAAGNTDLLPASRTWTVSVDSTAPNTTIGSGPSGTVASDAASFEFSSSESGSTFECRLDSGAWGSCTSPKDYSDLADGAHTFRVRATDAAGNTDGSPATRNWTVDTGTAPAPPTASFTFSPDTPDTGEEVTFDATGSTCAATPCTYAWHDVNGGTFSLGTGQTMEFTFQNAGDKHVRLTVTDALDRSAQAQQTVTVTPADPPPPPPPPPPGDSDGDGVPDDQDACPNEAGTQPDGCNPLPPSGTCNLNATPSNFASQVSAAQAGQTVCLATGNYGTWTGTNKAITVQAAPGAAPTMKVNFTSNQGGLVLDGMRGMGAPSDIRSSGGNFTIRNSVFTSKIWISRSATTPITLDNNTHNDISGIESRLCICGGGTNVVVKNSLFQGGGSDGVRIASPNAVIGPGNRFIGFEIVDSNHTDPIQFFSGLPGFVGDTRITGNYFDQPEGTGDVVAYIAAWDGTSNNVIDNNVFRAVSGGSGGGHGIAYSVALYADRNSVIRNNTMERGTCNHNIRCGTIMLASKSGYPSGTGTIIRDNVMTVVGTGNGSSFSADHNLVQSSLSGTGNVVGAPSFVGPLGTWAGWRLAPGSAGKGIASDGGDAGIR
jgi:PKD domain/Bacterial TSP3 repeat